MRYVITGAIAVTLLASCGGHSSTGHPAAQPATPQQVVINSPTAPSVTQVKAWATAWCSARPGMTRAQMRALMGPPTGEFSVASGTPQMSWEFAEYHFDAFMNVDDKVRQLDINASQMAPAERAAIHCATTRR